MEIGYLAAVLAGAVVPVRGGGEGEWNADYDEEKRNMASSGFLCILDKKTQ